MAQSSTIINDGNGAQVLTAINAALETVKTMSSGPSAPASPVAFMLWADTVAGKMKQRNSANNGWVDLWDFNVSGISGSVVSQQVFTSVGASTWAKPAKGTIAKIQVWGAGGGYYPHASLGAGGAGGGYSEKWILLSALAATESITVGNGGTAGQAGGDSTFGGKVTAQGGKAHVYNSVIVGTGESAYTRQWYSANGGPPENLSALDTAFNGGDAGYSQSGSAIYTVVDGKNALYGGAGGGTYSGGSGTSSQPGLSAYGGNGGAVNASGAAPGGGAGYGGTSGGRGQVIVTVF